ncbi:MAG: cytochrome c3 family protein [Hyphomicrobium sp.]
MDCHKDIAEDIKTKTRFHGKSVAASSSECRHCHTDHKGRKADIVLLDPSTFDHSQTSFALAGRHTGVACSSCHAGGKKFRTAPTACVACHRKDDVHGGKLRETCADCHNDKGWKSTTAFDHSKTNFALTGGHKSVECARCHAGERYKGVPTACAECHRERDVHNGARGQKCDGCHTTKTWAEAKFDHDVDTKFPLLGKHTAALCESCHKQPPKQVKPERACNTCHKKDDVHKGKLGPECQNCHNESGFKIGVLFDHDKSRFILRGKHQSAKCGDCHKTKLYKDTTSACIECHRKKDEHEGRLGAGCGSCHGAEKWKGATFDHGKTRFALTGRHAQTGCYNCHKQKHVQRASLATGCYGCHRSQDKHRGLFGRNCGSCHTTSTFGVAYIRR